MYMPTYLVWHFKAWIAMHNGQRLKQSGFSLS